MKQIAENLKMLREEKNLSKQRLADFCKVSLRSYARYESGETIPSLEVLMALAKYYGVTVDDLLTDSSDIKLDLTKMISYRDIVNKGFNGSLAHGLIKEALLFCSPKDYKVVGLGKVKYVSKNKMKVLLETLMVNLV